jgi:hypothetical protein
MNSRCRWPPSTRQDIRLLILLCSSRPRSGGSVLATTALPRGVSSQWLGLEGPSGRRLSSLRERSAVNAARAASARSAKGSCWCASVLLQAAKTKQHGRDVIACCIQGDTGFLQAQNAWVVQQM